MCVCVCVLCEAHLDFVSDNPRSQVLGEKGKCKPIKYYWLRLVFKEGLLSIFIFFIGFATQYQALFFGMWIDSLFLRMEYPSLCQTVYQAY